MKPLDKKNFTVVTRDPIAMGDWVFKVSANEYEHGVLIFATNYVFEYACVKYFANHHDGRAWIDTLVSYTKEILSVDIEELSRLHLKKPVK